MKPLPLSVASLGFLLILSCEKQESPAAQMTSNIPTGNTEPELIETKERLRTALSERKSRIASLEAEISTMKEYLDELQSNLALLDAEKKKMMDDGLKLKKRWEQETEGIICEMSRTIPEQFRELTQKMDQLLQENQELKRKLEEATK
jgi:predicted  nucleic acid-binding Zn-ribbon protein